MIAVRARVDEELDPSHPDLEREGVGVAVRGDRQEPLRPAVAAAPQLRLSSRGAGSQDVQAGVVERRGEL